MIRLQALLAQNAARLIAGAIVITLIVGLAIFGPAACNRYLAEKKAGQIARGQGKATLDSVDVAASTAAELDLLEQETRSDAKARADAVRAATAGDSNDAALAASCAMKVYRDLPECQPKVKAP